MFKNSQYYISPSARITILCGAHANEAKKVNFLNINKKSVLCLMKWRVEY